MPSSKFTTGHKETKTSNFTPPPWPHPVPGAYIDTGTSSVAVLVVRLELTRMKWAAIRYYFLLDIRHSAQVTYYKSA